MSDVEFSMFDREAVFLSRKKALLREAGRQFTEFGFHGTSLDKIAKALKLTKAGLYHYVKNKEELIYLCYKAALESAENCMTTAEELDGTGLQKLSIYIENHMSLIDDPNGYFVTLGEMFVLSPHRQKTMRERARSIDDRMVALVELGVQDGSIRSKTDPRMIVYCIQGSLNWVPKWYRPNGPKSINEVAADFLSVFEQGLA